MNFPIPSDKWYYAQGQNKVGPVSMDHLRRLLAEGVLKPEDMVFQEGTQQWRSMADVAHGAQEDGESGWRVRLRGSFSLVPGNRKRLALLVSAGSAILILLVIISWSVPSHPGNEATNNRELPGDEAANNRELQHRNPPDQDGPGTTDEPTTGLDSVNPREPDPTAISRQPARLVPQIASGFLSVAISPDGKQVLTGGLTAQLWDTSNGKAIRAFHGDFDLVSSVAFSPDGKQVLTADNSRAALWDAATGEEIRDFRGHLGVVNSVAFSPDGKQILTGSYDKTARLWDATSGKEIRSFQGHGGGVSSVAFSSDGKRILTGGGDFKGGDGTARLWDAATGKEIRSFRGELSQARPVAFSPDGNHILTGESSGVRLWDAASGKEMRFFRVELSRPVRDASLRVPTAFSPDGKQVLAGSLDGTVRLWDAATGKEIRSFREHPFGICGVAFTTNGKQVLTASLDGTAQLWDLTSDKGVRTFQGHTDELTVVEFSPDGKQILTGSGDGAVRLWQLATGKAVRAFQGDDFFTRGTRIRNFKTAVAFSPDGKQLLMRNNRQARLWDMVTDQEIRAFPLLSTEVCLAYSPNGKQVLLGTTLKALLYDTTNGSLIRTFPHYQIRCVAFSPDGRQILMGCGMPDLGGPFSARLWDIATGKEIRAFRGHTYFLQSVAFSPDGKQVLTGSLDRTARLWDVSSGKEIRTFRHPGLWSAAISPDGKQVLTVGMDKAARLWDVSSGKEIRAFLGHDQAVRSGAFSPDGKHVLTGSSDSTARLWEAGSGREICRLLGFRDGTWAAATPDHYYIGSKGSLKGIAFGVGMRAFPFDQFDLKFNRPDKVVERIGLASSELVIAYRHAYQKRLNRMNFTEKMLNDDFHIPEVSVNASKTFTTSERSLKLKVKASDSKYLLDRLYVEVNGVSVHGAAGLNLRKHASKSWEQEVEVELSSGNNKIDVSVLNVKGAESLKGSLSIRYDIPPRKPNLYVVSVGVSTYQDSRFQLTYADKDASDLADLLSRKAAHYSEVKVRRILNRDATRETILKAREFLKGSQVDDIVVLFFAGHGLLDSKLDYFYATADVDFAEPAKRGLHYDAIESLLDGIPARKKLLLMDTCHSGELDMDDAQLVLSGKKPEGEIKARGFRGPLTRVPPKVGLRNSYQLLQELFADLRRGTGAVVIASAGGAEYALESEKWKNGVFTHAVLRGLKGEADRNRDDRVQMSELRDFVEQEVRRLTDGRQSPTARRENLALDFTID